MLSVEGYKAKKMKMTLHNPGDDVAYLIDDAISYYLELQKRKITSNKPTTN